jgi:hypothetical protein
MTIRAFDRLVARAIVDPRISYAVSNGSRAEILAEAGFQKEICDQLTALQASTWEVFAADAYRLVSQAEPKPARRSFPSTADGLIAKGFEHKLAA